MADCCTSSETKEGLLERIMPSGVHLICGMPVVTRQRQKIVPFASGDVVEVGFGTGLNLPHYDTDKVRSLIGINPDDGLPRHGRKAIAKHDFPAELLIESAEAMSLPSECADSVVVTYSLCSIPDVDAALGEMHRILRPGGKLFFCEHGRSPKRHVSRMQDSLTPPWRWMAAGCHLNREVGELVQANGFVMQTYDVYDLGFGSRIMGTHHVGIASKR